MKAPPSPPRSRRLLDIAIERFADGGEDPLRIRRVMANAIVGQMLPNGVLKGGSALKLRFGDASTRFTRDLDAARTLSETAFEEALSDALAAGWQGFTGRLVRGRKARPRKVPGEYVMQPYDVKLDYNGKPWMTVALEVGHNEIGDADRGEPALSPDIAGLFSRLGFPEPGAVPLMPLSHQIAQKLHAVSAPRSHRAHDLIDLQLIMSRHDPDWAELRGVCRRLFAYRKQQTWPPAVESGSDWDTLYAERVGALPVLPTAAEAVAWLNALIARIDAAR